jgi:large subunit ribosomal protein L29
MSHAEVVRFRAMSDSELQTSLLDYRKEQLNLRFQKVNGQLTNTSRVREVRRLIARVKTEQVTRVRVRVSKELKK